MGKISLSIFPDPPFNSFPTDRSKADPLLQFFCDYAPVVSYVAFVLSVFVPISPSLGASGRLCSVIVAFLGIFTYILFNSI